MKKLTNEELKFIKAGNGDCTNVACDCVDAFMTQEGMSFDDAYYICVHVFGLDPREP